MNTEILDFFYYGDDLTKCSGLCLEPLVPLPVLVLSPGQDGCVMKIIQFINLIKLKQIYGLTNFGLSLKSSHRIDYHHLNTWFIIEPLALSAITG